MTPLHMDWELLEFWSPGSECSGDTDWGEEIIGAGSKGDFGRGLLGGAKAGNGGGL